MGKYSIFSSHMFDFLCCLAYFCPERYNKISLFRKRCLMIHEVKLTTIDQVISLLTEQTYDESIKRFRSPYVYRGIPNVDFKLETSIKRNCKSRQKSLEKVILRSFTKYAALEDQDTLKSVWHQLFIGQQHGLPTRLLDWTFSPTIAMHFATSGEQLAFMDKHDAVLWKLNIEEMNSLLPEAYRLALEKSHAYAFTVDMLDELAKDLDIYDRDMQNNSMVLIEPPSIDERIINQYAYFGIVPREITDIEGWIDQNTTETYKYVIDKDLKWHIRDVLDQMNVNERIVYPGLDGLSTWIKRMYYVRD